MTQIDFYDKQQIDQREIGFPDDSASATGSIWARLKNAVSRIFDLETADADNVKKTGTSIVTGDLQVPTAPPTVDSAVNQSYVESTVEGVNNLLHKSANETKTGDLTLDGFLRIIRPVGYINEVYLGNIVEDRDQAPTDSNKVRYVNIVDASNSVVFRFAFIVQTDNKRIVNLDIWNPTTQNFVPIELGRITP